MLKSVPMRFCNTFLSEIVELLKQLLLFLCYCDGMESINYFLKIGTGSNSGTDVAVGLTMLRSQESQRIYLSLYKIVLHEEMEVCSALCAIHMEHTA